MLIEKKELAVAKAASQAQAKLAREELLVKAKEVAAKQGLERAVQAADGDVNVKLDKWLQSIAAMK